MSSSARRMAALALSLSACVGKHDIEVGDSTTANACDDLLDAAREPVSVAIEIRNERAEAILLPTACGPDYLDVVAGTLHWPGPWCEGTCEERSCGGCGGCNVGAYLRVEAGDAFVAAWPGLVYETVTPPEACLPELGGCGETCDVSRPPPATLSARAHALSLAACVAEAMDAQACTCTLSADGNCEAYGPEREPDLEAATDFAGDETTVVVVFGR